MRETLLPNREGLTQADGPVQIPLGLWKGARLHQVQIVTTDVTGTIKFRLRTPGSPTTFVPVDEYEVETVIDLSKINRVGLLWGFSDLIEVVPEGITGTYDVYICSGGA